MTHRRLLLLKWLMVVIPPVTVTVGHTLLMMGHSLRHGTVTGIPERVEIVLVTSFVTLLALGISYVFVKTLFRILQRLQTEALIHEQEILTISAVMQERERLGRELHDGAAQLVSHLLLRLDTIKELVETNRPQEAGAAIERLREVADEIYDDIGESIAGLRTNVAERGLVRALQDYVDQFEERHRIPVNLRADDLVDQLPSGAALQLFRLIQEALTNVRKHAAARGATVTLRPDGSGRLKVTVVDDGRGFVPSAERNGNGRPLGLTSMRERVESLGGTLEVQSEPGSGTRVTATIPMPRTRQESGDAALATPPG